MNGLDSELEQLIAALPLKERRARKRHWMYTLVALAAGIAWIGYSFYQVTMLRAESDQLRVQIQKQTESLQDIKKDLDAKNGELEIISGSLRIPLEDLQNLKNYDFLKGDQSAANLHAFVEQTKKAKAELQNIKSPTSEKARRAKISIRYYVRESDNGRVTVAMDSLHNDYGFRVVPNQGQKEPNTFTNAIWINRFVVNEEDVRLVAYYLLLRGIEIKYIGPPTSKAETVKRLVPEAVIVVAEPNAKDEPSLTVERIKDMSLSSLTRGTKTLNW